MACAKGRVSLTAGSFPCAFCSCTGYRRSSSQPPMVSLCSTMKVWRGRAKIIQKRLFSLIGRVSLGFSWIDCAPLRILAQRSTMKCPALRWVPSRPRTSERWPGKKLPRCVRMTRSPQASRLFELHAVRERTISCCVKRLTSFSAICGVHINSSGTSRRMRAAGPRAFRSAIPGWMIRRFWPIRASAHCSLRAPLRRSARAYPVCDAVLRRACLGRCYVVLECCEHRQVVLLSEGSGHLGAKFRVLCRFCSVSADIAHKPSPLSCCSWPRRRRHAPRTSATASRRSTGRIQCAAARPANTNTNTTTATAAAAGSHAVSYSVSEPTPSPTRPCCCPRSAPASPNHACRRHGRACTRAWRSAAVGDCCLGWWPNAAQGSGSFAQTARPQTGMEHSIVLQRRSQLWPYVGVGLRAREVRWGIMGLVVWQCFILNPETVRIHALRPRALLTPPPTRLLSTHAAGHSAAPGTSHRAHTRVPTPGSPRAGLRCSPSPRAASITGRPWSRYRQYGSSHVRCGRERSARTGD